MLKSLIKILIISFLLLSFSNSFSQEAGVYEHYTIYDTDLIKPSEYAARRQQVLDYLDSSMVLFLKSADIKNRTNDLDYDYKQKNNLFYLTGVTEDESALIISKRPITLPSGEKTHEVLFVKERNQFSEIWTGKIMGEKVAKQITKINAVLSINDLDKVLDSALKPAKFLLFNDWSATTITEVLTGYQAFHVKENLAKLKIKYPNLGLLDPKKILDIMRVKKSHAEIELMQKAIDISVEAHLATWKIAKAGMYEYELEAEMEAVFHKRGAEFPAYSSIVGSGDNGCVLHYISSRKKTKPNELVVMDCGAEYHGYCADVTRTIPISGKFTKEQKLIYDLVLLAQDSAIKLCRKGVSFREPHSLAVSIISKGLKKLGIIKDEKEYGKYFMHGTSHFLGLDVHDVGDTKVPLDVGMVLTVEPGVYIAPNSPCDKKWWGIGVRIEDDILVTDGDPINMSVKLPRRTEEIEAVMKLNK